MADDTAGSRGNASPRRKTGYDSKTTTSRRPVRSSKGGKNHKKVAADSGADAKNNAGHHTALEGETVPGSVAPSRPTTSQEKRDSAKEEYVDDGWETDFENLEGVLCVVPIMALFH